MTAVKIEHKIVAQAIAKKPEAVNDVAPDVNPDIPPAPPAFSEDTKRPDELFSITYKAKSPLSEHAMYITISDIIVNEGTGYEERRPYEIFINSKEMDHFQWIVANTRMISAVFRKGGDLTFLIDELKSIQDPNGGYYLKGGVFMPSTVAHIGSIIEKHLKRIGLIEDEEMSEELKAQLAEKRAAFEAQDRQADAMVSAEDGDEDEGVSYPPSATMCKSCNTKAVVLLDGCATCLSCGAGKCN